jgi:two-component system, OmpR family, heavy metal sensor histidine kinase CusS
MSSNPAESPPAAGKTSSSRRSWSLTARLAVLTAVSSFVILAAVSIQMYFQLANHLKEQNSWYLKDEVETLGQMARFPEFSKSLANEMHVKTVGEEYLTHYVRLLDSEGKLVIETPDMEKILPHKLFPTPKNDGKQCARFEVHGQNGSSFIATSLWVDTGMKQGVLQVGLDVTNVDKILAGYRNKFAIPLFFGFLLCAGTGYIIARRIVRPVREITEKARRITASSLDERLSGADWPRELNVLAGALNGMLDRLQDSFVRLYGSVANLTHKLRTPLTILRGEAEVALSQERSAEALREVIESSMEEYERLSHLVDYIIFIAQAEAGKLKPICIRMKAREEIDKVLDFYGPLAEEKGIAVTCEGNATLSADPALFCKAVANLLSNALTFTPSGGAVVISVRQGDDRSAEVSISDTGCGISAEDMPKIFDRFYRVYTTRFMDPKGSGLGLPLVKSIMALHAGSVEVLSQPGLGTTVFLRFPPPSG